MNPIGCIGSCDCVAEARKRSEVINELLSSSFGWFHMYFIKAGVRTAGRQGYTRMEEIGVALNVPSFIGSRVPA